MGEHASYHESIDHKEAERRLRKYGGDRSYLTRYSKYKKCYVLSVYQKVPEKESKHFKIDVQDGKCNIQGRTDVCDDITQMLEHYEKNRLDPSFRNIGKKFTREDYVAAQRLSLSIEEHPSYHHNISLNVAKQRLRKYGGDRCYLTRYNEEDESYMLSVHQYRPTPRVIKHFKTDIRDGKCNIHRKTEAFDDPAKMLEHYERRRLDNIIKDIGEICTEDHSRPWCPIL